MSSWLSFGRDRMGTMRQHKTLFSSTEHVGFLSPSTISVGNKAWDTLAIGFLWCHIELQAARLIMRGRDQGHGARSCRDQLHRLGLPLATWRFRAVIVQVQLRGHSKLLPGTVVPR